MPHDDEQPQDVSNTADEASGQFVQAGVVRDVNIYPPSPPRSTALPLRVGLVPLQAASFQKRATSELLTQTLDDGDTALLSSDRPKAAVLSGMGGVGKTQLAADYAARTWAAGTVDLMVWVTASSREAIVSSYADVSAKLTGVEDPDPERGARKFLEWLTSTSVRWLVVLDDLQAPADLITLWPPVTENGRVVVTTRRRDAALHGHRRQLVDVGVFSQDEAVAYLQRALAEQTTLLDDAVDLVRDLGCLPLALAQACAYMLDRHLACTEYRQRLAKRRLVNVMPELDGLPDEHQATVAATWSLSAERADRLAPERVARPLLEVASVLDANGIPIGAFTTRAVLEFLSAAAERAIDESEARDGLCCLHRLSLITLDTNSTAREVRVHALVQRATRDAWSPDHLGSVVRVAADAVLTLWSYVNKDPLFERVLRANADALNRTGGEHLWKTETGCHELLFRVGQSLGWNGLVKEAGEYFLDLQKAAAQLLGAEHPDTLSARGNHARFQGEAGDPAGAVAALEQLLTDRLRLLGSGHLDTLITRHNLAESQGEADDPVGAATALDELLTDCLRHLGPDHAQTLITRNSLARWRGHAGDAAGAAALLEQVLIDRLRVFGPDDPRTLTTRNNLANWMGVAGDLPGAMSALEQLHTDLVQRFGPDHLNTLGARNNLASLRSQAGSPTDIEAMFTELLVDYLRILGPDHPHTSVVVNNYACWKRRSTDTSG